MPLDDIRMSSGDLLDKEPLDAGGFGMVFLCCHRRHGLVVLKTVYTGPQRTEFNASLLEEGKIMHRLDHSRVVKLLGLILEDGNYSLVMEYMKKGNLMNVLQAVSVPLAVKGRFILEIIEGMSYLHKKNVIHKDLKPENILVDDDFHIKIADLGVASFQTWSKLTKEETNRHRKSKSGSACAKANGGTLYYMAVEHLESINAKPTEKSDVYSFGIVLWVIIAGKEPYEECDKEFRPIYCQQLEMDVEDGVKKMKSAYPSPRACVVRMESLHLDYVSESPSVSGTVVDGPHSLHSSQGLMVDAAVDETSFLPCPPNEPEESEVCEEAATSSLEKKLQDELSYHQHGSRLDQLENQKINVANERSRRVFHEMAPVNPASAMSQELHMRVPFNQHEDRISRSVPIYKVPDLKEEELSHQRPHNSENLGISYSTGDVSRTRNEPRGVSETVGNMHEFTSRMAGMSSIPKHPVPESTAGAQSYKQTLPAEPEEPVTYSISEGSYIQIGNYNYMTVASELPETTEIAENSYSRYKVLGIFECTTLVNKEHLDLVRSNLFRNWKTCARKLGLTEPEIDEIDHDYERDGLREKVYQMMYKWTMKEGSKNTTVGKLAKALYDCQRTDLLNSLIILTHGQAALEILD
ncbi:receptor-interacting serine/threonine-protein kinase 1 isoform X2 [Microcaecilia unicolor]|uniref:Receptor-interacting serine/threonine-protein kinase 1 isoform X2 n=1 Tax=Microcaecilia unicolor TaxID=1415580 RepID=A0A6P7YP50_9AMPH|nr:receptor-interacting serine/threonine-protein kinase 1 isoform X2 [Microcaecilia unicolor]